MVRWSGWSMRGNVGSVVTQLEEGLIYRTVSREQWRQQMPDHLKKAHIFKYSKVCFKKCLRTSFSFVCICLHIDCRVQQFMVTITHVATASVLLPPRWCFLLCFVWKRSYCSFWVYISQVQRWLSMIDFMIASDCKGLCNLCDAPWAHLHVPAPTNSHPYWIIKSRIYLKITINILNNNPK